MLEAAKEAAKLAELARDPTEEEAREAETAAVRTVEQFFGVWKEGAWEQVEDTLQRSWLDRWQEKVQSDEPEPLDARLIGEGAKPEGPTWKEATGGTVAGMLEQLIGSESLVLWTVDEEATQARSPVMVDVVVDAVLKDKVGTRRRQKITCRVICETDDDEPYPSDEGVWGLNPITVKTRREG